MIEPSQFEIDQARYNELAEKAAPIFEALGGLKNIKTAVEIAERKKQRRLIKIVIAIDGTSGPCKAMSVHVNHSPLPKPGHKPDRSSKYELGKYYVGIGNNVNLPGIISGPFDGAVPVPEGHTPYVYDGTYGLVKVD